MSSNSTAPAPAPAPAPAIDTERLAARFRHFAKVECPEEPLYEALCRIVAADPRLLAFLSDTPDEQQRPNLWLAAVHDLLLAGAAHPLAAYYPSLGGRRAPDADLAGSVQSFAAEHETALRQLMRTRTTQTNEIGRCAVLWPALHAIAQRAGTADLALLDVGCSAGLNLGVDHYRYDRAEPGLPFLPTKLVGAQRPPTMPTPRIVHRLGIDPAPVSADDTAALRWLRACLWPSDIARATRFDQAVALMQQHRWPVQQAADCTARIEPWLASLPPGVQPVIFNSWVLTYFDAAALQRHIDTVTGLVRRTGAMWLSAEGPQLRIGPVDVPPAPPDLGSHTLWTLCSRVQDDVRFDLLARSHAHGRWLEWLA
ncbi:MAG: DUF2332 domain-containing protein [Rhizobacter sp.]